MLSINFNVIEFDIKHIQYRVLIIMSSVVNDIDSSNTCIDNKIIFDLLSMINTKLDEINKKLDSQKTEKNNSDCDIFSMAPQHMDSYVNASNFKDNELRQKLTFDIISKVPGLKTYNKILDLTLKYNEDEEEDNIDMSLDSMLKQFKEREQVEQLKKELKKEPKDDLKPLGGSILEYRNEEKKLVSILNNDHMCSL